jgi:hypothetical protein
MFVWITRPDSRRLFSSGWRHVRVWVEEPLYCHLPQHVDAIHSLDVGWSGSVDGVSAAAKPLLCQDQQLADAVWREIETSVAPMGLAAEAVRQWAQTKTEVAYDDVWKTNWWLIDDPRWEALCNLNHKRFLLRVDLRAPVDTAITRVVPRVQFEDVHGLERTLSITEGLLLPRAQRAAAA